MKLERFVRIFYKATDFMNKSLKVILFIYFQTDLYSKSITLGIYVINYYTLRLTDMITTKYTYGFDYITVFYQILFITL